MKVNYKFYKKNIHELLDAFIKQCQEIIKEENLESHKIKWYEGNIVGLETAKKVIESARYKK